MQLAQHKQIICPLIYVFADEEVVKERVTKPREDSEADFRVYQIVKEQFQEITEKHLRLTSTNDNISEMLEKAIDYIDHEPRTN